jgi:hypothetical protein
MPGFRRSTWFALGLMMGSLIGSALGLLFAPAPVDIVRHRLRAGVGSRAGLVRGVAARLARRDDQRTGSSETGLETEIVPQEASDET